MSAEAARFLNGDPENYDEHVDSGGDSTQINIQTFTIVHDNRELGEGLVQGARLDKKLLCLVVTLILVFVLIGLTVGIVFLSSILHHITAHPKEDKLIGYLERPVEQECRPGSQDVACSEKCRNCFNDTCDPETGKCLHECKAGWSGKLCNEACPLGKYGRLCSHTCGHCFNITCHSVTGECLHGCAMGWRGLNCDTECRPGSQDVACSEKCRNCFNDTCDPATGKCLHECKAGWSGKLCNEECRPGSQDVACSEKCRNCFNDTCDLETGKCLQEENEAGSAAERITLILFVSCLVLVTVIIVFLRILIKAWLSNCSSLDNCICR